MRTNSNQQNMRGYNNYSYTPNYGNNMSRANVNYSGYNMPQGYYQNNPYNTYSQQTRQQVQNQQMQKVQQARLAAQHGNHAVQRNQQFSNYRSGKNLKKAKARKLRKNRSPEQLFQEAKVRALRGKLKPPAAWLPSNEISLYAKMGTPASKISSSAWLTTLLTMMLMLIIIAAAILTKKFLILAFVPVAPILILVMDVSLVKTSYASYKFYRQLLFTKFATILDLSELKRGLSINELLSRAAMRMNDKQLERAVETLNSRIEDDPISATPYMSFADKFSDTPDARLYMSSVHRMARGFYDDSEIHSLKVNSGKDLMYQSHVLMRHKLSRFIKIRTILFGGFVVFLIWFMLSFVVITVLQLV